MSQMFLEDHRTPLPFITFPLHRARLFVVCLNIGPFSIQDASQEAQKDRSEAHNHIKVISGLAGAVYFVRPPIPFMCIDVTGP